MERGGCEHKKDILQQSDQPFSKCRKYRDEFIQYGFTCVIVNGVQHPQCVVCTEVLAHESLKPVKMLRDLKTKHSSLAVKPVDFFQRKERELQGQKKVLTKKTTIPAQRISDMAQDIKCQLVDRVNKGKYALQLDESTDVSNSPQLLVFVRYSFEGKLNEDILFCTPLE